MGQSSSLSSQYTLGTSELYLRFAGRPGFLAVGFFEAVVDFFVFVAVFLFAMMSLL